jgi:undecaprenyl-phosphate 4-deoxy-4-formamido-L-arabinose transferase
MNEPIQVGAPEVTVVIPLYRSAGSIGRVVGEIEEVGRAIDLELVLVNDGSPDNTLEVCREIATRCRVPLTLVNLSRNFGEHNAVMAGYRHARGRWVVNLDDDGQNPPAEIPRLLEAAKAGGHEVVFGRYRTKQHSLWRNLGSWFANKVAEWTLDKPPGLYLSSFRCVSGFVAREVTRYEGPYPYIDGLILQVTNKLGSIDVDHRVRDTGASGYTLRKLVRLWMNMFVNFSVQPLRLATWLGLLMGAAGACGVVWVAALWWSGKGPSFGWGSLMAALLLFSGTQMLMLGLIGEYLGRTYLSTNRRPQSIERDVQRVDPKPGR